MIAKKRLQNSTEELTLANPKPLKIDLEIKCVGCVVCDYSLQNQIGEFTNLCRICGPDMTILEAVAPAVNSLACDIPSTCTRPPGIPCNMNDTIPKGCLVTTTECPKTTTEPTKTTTEPTTTTTDPVTSTIEPTITTTEPTTTTTEPTKTTKRDCGKKNRKHTK
ncbi:EPHA8 [Mytilus coruscus]|uniref:EPHA8 n=1 Tax=Mytilus coruscus TaxID=42192 RepID=A0A6J8A531_MYTCO|nr:EPHA8 [Mytilus coruscus]